VPAKILAFGLYLFFIFFAPQERHEWLATIRPALFSAAVTAILMFITRAGTTQEKNQTHLKSMINTYLMAVLCVLMIVSNILSPFESSILPEGLVSFIKLAVLYYLTVGIVRTEQDLKIVIKIIFIFGSVIAIYSLVGPKIGWVRPTYRLVSPFGGMGSNSNGFAMLLLGLLPFAVMYMQQQESPIRKAIYMIVALGIVMCIIKTRSRMGFLGLIFQFGIFAWDNRKKISALILVVLIITVALFRAHENLWERVATVSAQSLDASKYSAARPNKWRQAVVLIKRHPITGVGINQFRQAVIQYDLGEYKHIVHNAFLEIGAEAGIFNMLLFTMLIFSRLKKLFNNSLIFYRRNNELLTPVIRAVLISIVFFSFCLIFLSEQYNSMLYILLGLAAGCDKIVANYKWKTSAIE
jgi:O-antigen ligase